MTSILAPILQIWKLRHKLTLAQKSTYLTQRIIAKHYQCPLRYHHKFSSVQSLSHSLWTAAHQASLSITISQGLLKLMSIESVMPSNHLILCHPHLLPCLQSFPASGSSQMSQLFASSGQSIRVSASTSILPMNIQDLFPLGWTGWISLQSKGLLSLL